MTTKTRNWIFGIGAAALSTTAIIKLQPSAPVTPPATFQFSDSKVALNKNLYGYNGENLQFGITPTATDTKYYDLFNSLLGTRLRLCNFQSVSNWAGAGTHFGFNVMSGGDGYNMKGNTCARYDIPSMTCPNKDCSLDASGCYVYPKDFQNYQFDFAAKYNQSVTIVLRVYQDYANQKIAIDYAKSKNLNIVGAVFGKENQNFSGYDNKNHWGNSDFDYRDWGNLFNTKFTTINNSIHTDYKISTYNDYQNERSDHDNQNINWNKNVKSIPTDGAAMYYFDNDLNKIAPTGQTYEYYRDYVLKLGDSCLPAKVAANPYKHINVISYGNSQEETGYANTFLWWASAITVNMAMLTYNGTNTIDAAYYYRPRMWNLNSKDSTKCDGAYYLFKVFGKFFTESGNYYTLKTDSKYIRGVATKNKAVFVNLADTDYPISISVDGKTVSPLTVDGAYTTNPLSGDLPIPYSGGTILKKYSITVITF